MTASKSASVKKKAPITKKKRAAAAKKAVAPKAKKKPVAKKMAAVAKKMTAVATRMAAVAKKASAAKKPRAREIPAPRPSERAMAVAAQLPVERPLTDEERDAMNKCAQTALAALQADGVPEVIVRRIGGFVDAVRAGKRAEPKNQDVRLGMGVLWGEQVRAQVGWRWVHLSYPNGFASYALVPDDRAFACFPLNRLSELMRPGRDGVNTSVPLFDSIRVGTLPGRRENAYLVIG